MIPAKAGFSRILEIALPIGGNVLVMVEGYFDESYRIDEYPQTFCVAGYLVSLAAARDMDAEWLKILDHHGILFFHMADCAHGTIGSPFEHKSLQERVEIETKCIDLIKRFTVEGFAVVATEATYHGFAGDDIYSDFVDMSVTALDSFLSLNRIQDDLAFFFESGHASEGRAYARVAQRLQDPTRSVTFGTKQRFRLLQAADILAWQTRKYVQDLHSGKRTMRKDFESLLAHPHTFFHVVRSIDGGSSLGVEVWPLTRRSQRTALYDVDRTGPITLLREEGEDLPIIPIDKTTSWRMGGGRAVYVAFEDFGGKKFALAFDQPRLSEAVKHLIAAFGIWDDASVPTLYADGLSVLERNTETITIGISLRGGARIALVFPIDAVRVIPEG